MAVFHHKTKHKKFAIGLPLILLAQIILAYTLTTRPSTPTPPLFETDYLFSSSFFTAFLSECLIYRRSRRIRELFS